MPRKMRKAPPAPRTTWRKKSARLERRQAGGEQHENTANVPFAPMTTWVPRTEAARGGLRQDQDMDRAGEGPGGRPDAERRGQVAGAHLPRSGSTRRDSPAFSRR